MLERKQGWHRVIRFVIAMASLAGLGVAAWRTMEAPLLRAVTLAVLASFAVRIVLVKRSREREDREADKGTGS
jgi:hypothetical protein